MEKMACNYDPELAGLALIHACEAARNVDTPALQTSLNEFYRLPLTTPEKLTFISCILDNLPEYETVMRQQLLTALKELHPEQSIESSLCVARNFALIGNTLEAVRYSLLALSLAENFYKASWPDIASVIGKDGFVCALHHYALYGKNENRGWRDLCHFFFALQSMQNCLPLLKEAHMRLYDYTDRNLAKKMIDSLLE